MADAPLRVCLERTVELDSVRLRVRDWPGHCGAIVHIPDPLQLDDAPAAPADGAITFVDTLAAAFAPRWRILSVLPRAGVPYQLSVADVVGVLDQFGFVRPVLIGEGLGCLVALIVAAWFPSRAGALILLKPQWQPPGDGPEARALLDCPPDRGRLRAQLRCPVYEASGIEDVQTCVASLP